MNRNLNASSSYALTQPSDTHTRHTRHPQAREDIDLEFRDHVSCSPTPPMQREVGQLEWVSWHELYHPAAPRELRMSAFCAAVISQVRHV